VPSILVEACVETVSAALRAEAAGCQRIELCVSLHEGGVTPSVGLIAACAEQLSIPVHVLVRPRAGDFVYDTRETDIIFRDIAAAKTAGAAGVVIGLLDRDDAIDVERVRECVHAAQPLTVGFHRAFDRVPDQPGALRTLMAAGVSIVLTSGAAPTALAGATRLRTLVETAGDAMQILAGGKITAANVGELVSASGVRAVHASAFEALPAAVQTMAHR
jgi:copper homeostasis protein